jgi:VWFA-related protein
MRRPVAIACLGICLATGLSATEQSSDPANQAISVRSSLVLVPALVKTKSGEIVFSLTAQDFLLTDNGILQTPQLEQHIDSQPLALAVIVQTGGTGAAHLDDYRGLDAVLDALIGNVPHRVAVIAFDSAPHLAQDFTPHTDTAAATVSNLQPGDPGVAILDAVQFGIDLLGKQPPEYRRAVLLFSETLDDGSQTGLEDAVRAVVDTNTAIYSFGFSSTKAAVKHEVSKPRRPGGSPYHGDAYLAGGCMSRDADADPDARGNRSVQGLDCAEDLLPPLRLGRMAFVAARDSLRRNVPESVAQMTGGEYFPFRNAKTLNQHLVTISNDALNYYVLSFHPQSPSLGAHALEVKLKERPGLKLRARTSYWVAGTTKPPPQH